MRRILLAGTALLVAVAPASAAPLAGLYAGRGASDHLPTIRIERGPASTSGSGIDVVTRGGRLFLFDRYQVRTDRCLPLGIPFAMGTRVRVSADGGRRWSSPTKILPPVPGTPWECGATDGSAHYDARRREWTYLGQCIADDGRGWGVCAWRRRGVNPRGRWLLLGPQPVVEMGAVRDQAARTCVRDARCARWARGDVEWDAAGTFDLVSRRRNGTWWVGMHVALTRRGETLPGGYPVVRGVRVVMAAARGFRRFVAPRQAPLTPADARGFDERWAPGGPVGIGAGSIVREGGWWYHLADVTDRTLVCVAGQHWDVALFRSRSMRGPWRPAPASPLLRGRGGGACPISYPVLARLDGGRMLVAHTSLPRFRPFTSSGPNAIRLATIR